MNSSVQPLLIANGLSQRYADHLAVDDVSLHLYRGQVLGLLGLNGAGKTSTLNMLAGVLTPHSGEILINGVSLHEQPIQTKRRIGYLPEVAPLYTDMRVLDYLIYAGQLRGLNRKMRKERAETLLEQLYLRPLANKRIAKLSKGYRQRVGLGQALVHEPALLILDEPSSGLDPEQMREMRALIQALSANAGVIFSSHMLNEVTALCDRVIVLHHGQQIYAGELDMASSTTGRFIVSFDSFVAPDQLVSVQGIEEVEQLSETRFAVRTRADLHGQLLPRLIAADFVVVEFMPERPSLETLFGELVGNNVSSQTTFVDLS